MFLRIAWITEVVVLYSGKALVLRIFEDGLDLVDVRLREGRNDHTFPDSYLLDEVKASSVESLLARTASLSR